MILILREGNIGKNVKEDKMDVDKMNLRLCQSNEGGLGKKWTGFRKHGNYSGLRIVLKAQFIWLSDRFGTDSIPSDRFGY